MTKSTGQIVKSIHDKCSQLKSENHRKELDFVEIFKCIPRIEDALVRPPHVPISGAVISNPCGMPRKYIGTRF